MGIRRHRMLLGIAFVAFVSLGLPDGVLGVAWPSIRRTFGLPLSQFGALLAAMMAGYLVSSFNSGQIVGRALVLHEIAVPFARSARHPPARSLTAPSIGGSR